MIYLFGLITDNYKRVSVEIRGIDMEHALKALKEIYPEPQYRIESWGNSFDEE